MCSRIPKIAILTDSFYPVIGGGEAHAKLLGAELCKKGMQVQVYTRRKTSDSQKYELVDQMPVYRVGPQGMPRLGKYFMIPSVVFKMIKRSKDYDIIYVCGLRVLGAVGVILSSVLGKKCVLRSESCTEFSGQQAIEELSSQKIKFIKPVIVFYFKVRNKIMYRADCFVSISRIIRNEYISCGVPVNKIKDVPNGIDIHYFVPVDSERKRLMRQVKSLPDRTLFVYTGKLNKGKGLEFLLKAWSRFVARRNGDVHLVMVGSGGGQYLSCENLLKHLVLEYGIEKNVTFTGYKKDVRAYLQCSDIFIFPSDSEAFGLSLIEAMSCGLPGIATKTGGIIDIVDHNQNGLLVESGDEQKIIEYMNMLADNVELRSLMGLKARKTVIKKYSIHSIVQTHHELFSRLLI
jgi:glycosyltransferase involved in cell wall biosynthesis